MTEKRTMVEALRLALNEAMGRNDRVLLLGEDIGENGGVFRVTKGLIDEYGDDRVIDTPLNEGGIVGFAIGMALYGLRPIAEVQFVDFIYPAFAQIQDELSKFRYRSGGSFSAPVVIRAPYGGGVGGAINHSQSPENFFVHTPGLKVVIPSGPYDAKGLLTSVIHDPDPVIFLEPKRIYHAIREEVPKEEYKIPLGQAKVVREGDDVTILSYGSMLHVALNAAERAVKEHNIDCEVIDLRTLLPLDILTIETSVKKTGRVVNVTEETKTSSFSSELSALIAERYIDYMYAPILRVTGYDTPFPLAQENAYLPSPTRVLDKIERVYNY